MCVCVCVCIYIWVFVIVEKWKLYIILQIVESCVAKSWLELFLNLLHMTGRKPALILMWWFTKE